MPRLIVWTVATLFLSLVLHLVLGWAWTAVAGIVAGIVLGKRGWLVGLAGVALGWALLVGFSFAVAPYATAELTRILGGLMGNMPGFIAVAATVSLGALLGAVGGLLGSQLRASIVSSRRGSVQTTS